MHRRAGLLGIALVLVVLAIAGGSVIGSAASSSPPLIVPTASGDLLGVANGDVREWRGIPYAAPPIGDSRWRAPAAVTPWSGVRDASSFAPPCIQLGYPAGTVGSEDCLYLNVFVPAGATSSSNLAVMVHLHPGSNTFGESYKDAQAFTSRGVVVVTVGYRLGALGFVGHPKLSAEANGSSGEYGVLDQLAALWWVRNNIAAFGGDPDNVTLFGSSAGSFDTVALMASPLSEGLIARAAVQGEAHWGLTGQFNTIRGGEAVGDMGAEGIGADISTSLGCATATDELACLRSLPASDLVEAAGFLDLLPWIGGTVLPQSPLALLSAGTDLPLLVGFNREEDAFGVVFDGHEAAFLSDPNLYGNNDWTRDTDKLVGANRGKKARSLYPPATYGSRLWARVAMLTDAVRGCPTRRLANTVAAHAPVWRYLYAHAYTTAADPYFNATRANHYFEEQLLWHTTSGALGPDTFAPVFGAWPLTESEETLSARMTGYWTNFAKTGNPNGTSLPPWPAYSTSKERTFVLDTTTSVLNRYHSTECAFIDAVPILWPSPWEQARGRGPSFVPPGHS